jgi:hypothetical protein
MGKLSSRLLAFLLTTVAFFFGVRALILFWVLVQVPVNFLPAAKGRDGCPLCPARTFFSGETEQIITILASLIVIALAWILWHKSTRTPE